MVRKALVAGAVASPVAYGAGVVAAGPEAGLSALLGLIVVVLNFAAHGLSLAWAAGVSIVAVQAVALGGFIVRMGVITAVLFALDRTAFFSPPSFGVAVVVSTIALLTYEVRVVRAGIGTDLEIPPDPAATRAAEALRAREGAR